MSRTADSTKPNGNTAIAVWGTFGVVAILGQAIYRLAPLAIAPFAEDMVELEHMVVAAVWTAAMLYTEGYNGFQRRFSPRVVARAFHLARNPRPLFVALAPLFCFGLFHATRRRVITAYAFLIGIVLLVIAVHQLEQPWRGVVDTGVVGGLLWGEIAILVFFVRALSGRPLPVPPDVPGEQTAA